MRDEITCKDGEVFEILFNKKQVVRGGGKCKNQILHRNYIIGIVSFLFIVAIALLFLDIPDLFKTIAVTIAILSIVLSILTIIYSLSSSSSLTKSITMLHSAAKDVSDKAKELSYVPEKMDKIEESIKSLSLLEVEVKTESIEKSNDFVDNFWHNSNLRGAVILYICYLSYSKNQMFDLTKFKSSILNASISHGYMAGYMVATRSIGLISFTSRTTDEVIITEMDKRLADIIKNEMKKKISKLRGTNEKIYMEAITEIDDYFDE